MTILGIETSCDETAAAIIKGQGNKIKVLSNIVSSQINIHQKYGGVVPEVAAREHVLNILPVINEALNRASISHGFSHLAEGKRLKAGEIDALAATAGPGLITSLQVGMETAKVLSYAWQIPIIAINHIEGHIYANFISKLQTGNCKFPSLVLTVSGGHTMLVLMKNHGNFKTISQTRDDAAGEAFDKAAKLLGLGYPGGPTIAAEAEKIQNKKYNNTNKLQITLPRPMINSNSMDFSFSGLKTALLYAIQKDKNWKKRVPAYAHEFQQAVIDVLIQKTVKTAKKYKINTVMLTGGVAANLELRKQMSKKLKADAPRVNFIIPDLKYTTDNAAMIAAAGYYKALRQEFTPWQELKVDCNQKL